MSSADWREADIISETAMNVSALNSMDNFAPKWGCVCVLAADVFEVR